MTGHSECRWCTDCLLRQPRSFWFRWLMCRWCGHRHGRHGQWRTRSLSPQSPKENER